ncbi:MAG: hypothetical protein AAF916_13210, partial [Planctomycetota bacterium]
TKIMPDDSVRLRWLDPEDDRGWIVVVDILPGTPPGVRDGGLFEIELRRGDRVRDRHWLRVRGDAHQRFAFRVHAGSHGTAAEPLSVSVLHEGREYARSAAPAVFSPVRAPRADNQGRWLAGSGPPDRPMGDRTRIAVDAAFDRWME